MNPEEWTMGDSIAAWILMAIPMAAGIGVGRLLNYFRTKEDPSSHSDRPDRFL